MVRKALVISLWLLAAQAMAQDQLPATDGEKPYYFEKYWQEKNAPRGFMVADDGKVLITIGTDNAGSEYGIVLDDYVERDATWPKLWIYGYHKGNKSVVYRTSKQQVRIDCKYKTIQTTFWISFKADKSTLYTNNNPEQVTPVVPGSLGEQWYEYACRAK